MKLLFKLALLLMCTAAWSKGSVDEVCLRPRFADIGWTDVSATTAVATALLKQQGYRPSVLMLSLPVALAGMKNEDVDVFLGNWMPTQEADVRPYLKDGSVYQIQKNLSNTHYTLAVPKYVYEAGVRSFGDLKRYAEKFNHAIYGIEPGNDGNRLLLSMIEQNVLGLKDFTLVESSEQAMLVEVKNAIKQHQWVVFLAWSPHPMNLDIDLRYLDGAEAFFGKNKGEGSVFTLVRPQFAKDCPQIAAFLKAFVLDVESENQLMQQIIERHQSPDEAAQHFLTTHPQKVLDWLLSLPKVGASELPQTSKTPQQRLVIGESVSLGIAWLLQHAGGAFRVISDTAERLIVALTQKLLAVPAIGFILAVGLLLWVRSRDLLFTGLIALLLLVMNGLSFWEESIQTLVLVLVATATAVPLGVVLGILCAKQPWFFRVLQPILDLMQTVPTFVYLIPTLMFFGLGVVPGILSTIVFALPAPIRLTYLGLSQVPSELKEAADAFGASSWQRLMQVEIPFARGSILEGLSQCVMLSLSMVVIAALVGAQGLGVPVVRALNTVNIAEGIDAGLSIVILAIVLDRCLKKGST